MFLARSKCNRRLASSLFRRNSLLVFVDHDNMALSNGTLLTITVALKIGGSINHLVVGSCVDKAIATEASKIKGVSKVLVIDDENLDHLLPEDFSKLFVKVCSNYTHVLAPSTNAFKSIIPRIAALCDSSPITDDSEVVDNEHFLRPMYAGSAIAKVKMTDKIKVSGV